MLLGRVILQRFAAPTALPVHSTKHHSVRRNRGGVTPAVCSATGQQQQRQRMAGGNSSNGSGPDGRDAGDNPIGQTIRTVYGVGGPHTIRWGLLKRPVEPVSQVEEHTSSFYLSAMDRRTSQRNSMWDGYASIAGWQHAQLAGVSRANRAGAPAAEVLCISERSLMDVVYFGSPLALTDAVLTAGSSLPTG
jgi:hypothetical protein